MTIPQWVQDAIFYQIFPDRFANGDPTNDPPGVAPWGEKPTVHKFQGGDLRGVIEKLNYLADLGITAIYFTPIFEAASTHRYDTTDYFHIDRKLGTLEDFKELLQKAHEHGIKVVLDGVFNHCGRGFFAFHDLLELEEHSGYREWFHVRRFPLNAYTPGKAVNYEGWWGYKGLPKFNTDNPAVRKMILDVAKYWIDLGIDGWRLDVPNEIDDDAFWKEFRQVVKSANTDAYILGEIWDANPRWVNDDHFDAVMNYPVRKALISWLNGEIAANGFGRQIQQVLDAYPQAHTHAMYVPLGSHDTERILTVFNHQVEKVKLAMLFQFTYPGAPAIYYGDEIGLTGEKDPDCRKAFPWDEKNWNFGLRNFVQKLIHLRKENPELRRGTYRALTVDPQEAVYAYERVYEGERIVVALNGSSEARTVSLRGDWIKGQVVSDLLSHEKYTIDGEMLNVNLAAWGAAILK